MFWIDYVLFMLLLIYFSMDWLCVIWFGYWRICTFIVIFLGYIGCYYGVLLLRLNWVKKISSVFVIVKVLICLDLCVLVDILFRLKRFVDSSRVFFLINVICLKN